MLMQHADNTLQKTVVFENQWTHKHDMCSIRMNLRIKPCVFLWFDAKVLILQLKFIRFVFRARILESKKWFSLGLYCKHNKNHLKKALVLHCFCCFLGTAFAIPGRLAVLAAVRSVCVSVYYIPFAQEQVEGEASSSRSAGHQWSSSWLWMAAVIRQNEKYFWKFSSKFFEDSN